MSLPVGVTTCTVTFGVGVTYRGLPADSIDATLTADRDVVWAATGTGIYSVTETLNGEAGSLSFVLPHVDQGGFIDAGGNATTHWYYTLNATLRFGGERKQIRKRFQVFVGDTNIDLDLRSDGPVEPGVTIPTNGVLSVAGLSDVVSVEDLVAAVSGPLSSTFAAAIATGALPKWAATTTYTTGQIVLNPSGDIVSAIAGFTSGASYNPANWTLVTARPRRVDMLTQGASADGATDDTAVFTAAKTLAGTKGTVHFPAKPGAATTTYFLAGSAAVDLAGTIITADPSVVISIYSTDYINLRTWSLGTPVTIYQRKELTTLVQPANVGGLSPSVALAAPLRTDDSTWSTLDFTTWTKRNYSLAAAVAVGASSAGTSTTAARAVTFTGTETAGTAEGVYTSAIAVGEEITVRARVGANSASGYLYVQVNSDTETVYWVIPDTVSGGANKGKLLRQRKTSSAAPTTQKTITFPEAAAYGPQVASAPQVAIRRTATNVFEIHVNGVLFDRITLAGTFADIGFALSATGYTATSGATLTDPIKHTRPAQVGGRIINIAVVGESTAFGASQALTWAQDMLPALLRGQPGVLDVVVTNLAHSGDKASDTLAIVNANSFATYDYTLILVGANDINAQTAQATYETSMTSIGTKIVADGSVPVFGIPPLFAYQSPGAVGPTRANYGKGSYIRQAVAWVAATNGWAIADVRAEMGAIGTTAAAMPQLFDGLHQSFFGGVLTARAFGRKLIALIGGVQP